MSYLTFNHAPSADDPPGHPFSALPPPPVPVFTHRQARQCLALALDSSTNPALLAGLEQHVAVCDLCRHDLEQLRRAENWFLAQPREAPTLAGLQDQVRAGIRVKIARLEMQWMDTALAPEPARQKLSSDQFTAPSATPESLPAATDEPEPLLADPLPAPIPARSSVWLLKSRTLLVTTLAASLLLTSLAAVVLTQLSHSAFSLQAATRPLSLADILDPGTLTPALSFDPATRQLFALTTNRRAECPSGMHCPPLAPCLRLSRLDVESGRAADALLSRCTTDQSAPRDTSFGDLLTDLGLGQALAVTLSGQVSAYDSRANQPEATYSLACCGDANAQVGQTLLDERDHMLLTTSVSYRDAPIWQTLSAQSEATGQLLYRTALPTAPFHAAHLNPSQAALFSDVTGWLYLWTTCATDADGLCVEVYEGKSGKKITTWHAQSGETPLAADPGQAVLYVRRDVPNGQSQTLALDAQSGTVRGALPPAWALGVNSTLHHAYLLSEAGVTAVNTTTYQVLSTLPVLAQDRNWTNPAVDEQADRVYVPTAYGKVLKVQDDTSGRLRLTSSAVQAVLNADRVMELEGLVGKSGLADWELPLGPGEFSLYTLSWQSLSDGCSASWVPARLEAAVTPLSNGASSVLISLDWTDPSATPRSTDLATAPPLQSTYPHHHSWRYQAPTSGDAQRMEEQGEAMPANC